MTTPTTPPVDLQAIEARCEAATEGPCSVTERRGNFGFPSKTIECLIHVGEGDTRGNAFMSVSLGGDGAISSRDKDIRANAEFVRAAFTDIPALLSLLREKDQVIERLERERDALAHEKPQWVQHLSDAQDELATLKAGQEALQSELIAAKAKISEMEKKS